MQRVRPFGIKNIGRIHLSIIMGNCLATRADEHDLVNSFDKRPESVAHKGLNDSIYRRSFPHERKTNKPKPLGFESWFETSSSLNLNQISEKEKSELDLEMLYNVLGQNVLFKNLPKEQQEIIMYQMKYYKVTAECIIIQEGTICNYFFVVDKGKVEVLEKGKRINVLVRGEAFGEIALIKDEPRNTSIKTMETCFL